MDARTAHTIGFSSGITYACADGGDSPALEAIRRGDDDVPCNYGAIPDDVFQDYDEGFREALEYFENATDDGTFEGIGSTDGVTYDQCAHRSRYV